MPPPASDPPQRPVAANLNTLPPGTVLERYVIDRVLAAGGFGVTYKARHSTLGKAYAIKEHFPRQFAYRERASLEVTPSDEPTFRWSLDGFVEEGRRLSGCKHPGVVGVADIFAANNTAYMVLEYEDGESFAAWVAARPPRPSQGQIDIVLAPLLDALTYVHEQGLIHRDIAPDNIMVRSNGTPVLIDFGAARQATAERSQMLTAIVKTGYSPPEQYSAAGRNQGPWSDIYALGATLYRAVTGKRPPDANDRRDGEPMAATASLLPGDHEFRPAFLSAIDASLVLEASARPQSVPVWREMLFAVASTSSGEALTRDARDAQQTPDVTISSRPERDIEAEKRTTSKPRDEPPSGPNGGIDAAKVGDQSTNRPAKPAFLSRRAVAAGGLITFAAAAGAAVTIVGRSTSPPGFTPTASPVTTAPKAPEPPSPYLVKKLSAGPGTDIQSLWLSPDGNTLISGHDDKSARIWDVKAGRVRQTFAHGEENVSAVAATPDMRTVATGTRHQVTRLWDGATGKLLRILERQAAHAGSLAFSPNGRWLATASEEPAVKIWDVGSGRLQRTLTGLARGPVSLAWSPDGAKVVASDDTGTISGWLAGSGSKALTFTDPQRTAIYGLNFSPDSKLLAAGATHAGSDKPYAPPMIHIVEAASGALVRSIAAGGGSQDAFAFVYSVAFIAGGRTVASTSSNEIALWDVGTGNAVGVLRASSPAHVHRLSSARDAPLLASGSGSSSDIHLWDLGHLK